MKLNNKNNKNKDRDKDKSKEQERPNKKKGEIKPLYLKSLLINLRNSLGVKTYRSFYVKNKTRTFDVLDNGRLSCAAYVSSMLFMIDALKHPRPTVVSLIKEMRKNNWYEIKKVKQGAVLVWEEIRDKKNEEHQHIGFYLGSGKAISNNSLKKSPIIHHWTYGEKDGQPKRKIIAIYWHDKLDNN